MQIFTHVYLISFVVCRCIWDKPCNWLFGTLLLYISSNNCYWPYLTSNVKCRTNRIYWKIMSLLPYTLYHIKTNHVYCILNCCDNFTGKPAFSSYTVKSFKLHFFLLRKNCLSIENTSLLMDKVNCDEILHGVSAAVFFKVNIQKISRYYINGRCSMTKFIFAWNHIRFCIKSVLLITLILYSGYFYLFYPFIFILHIEL